MNAADWRSRVDALVVDSSGRALFVPTEDGWRLPHVEVEADVEHDLRPASRALERLLGAPVTFLRYAHRASDEASRTLELVYVLETMDPPPVPAGSSWVTRTSLVDLALAAPEQRAVVDVHLAELELGSVSAKRVPWASDGWLAQAGEWIETSLAAHGRFPAGRVEQLRTWCLSCLLRVPTEAGAVYFKATAGSPLFVDEGGVMAGLASLFPWNVPAPLAVDAERRFMLLDDLGPELGWHAPLKTREDVFGVFAHMQVESVRRLDELLAIGCVDRRPAWLAAQAIELLADDLALAGLDEAEAERLRSLEPWLITLCESLANGVVPDALVHGDLHLGNVAERDGRYVFFDWTDACVTHPFLDLIDVVFERDEAVRSSVRDAYLSPWSDVAPMDRLLELWAIAEPLISLNQAVSYRHILANVEPGTTQTLDWSLPFFLRRILAAAR